MKILLLTVVGLLASQPAFAYLDPGTASLALQALIGGLAAAGVAVLGFASRTKAFLRRILGFDQKKADSAPRD